MGKESKITLVIQYFELNKDRPIREVNKEVAKKFRISPGTVRTYRSLWKEECNNVANEKSGNKVYVPRYKGRMREFFKFDDSKLFVKIGEQL